MFKRVAIGVGAAVVLLIGGVLIAAATKPDTLRVERSTRIEAPPERVFAEINDFHRWEAWSPYEKVDPAMKRTFSGPETGKGSVYEWAGNSNIGKGRMEITESTEPGVVTIDLRFFEPMEGQNVAEFTMEPDGDATRVTWSMRGPSPFSSKVIQVFLNMDKMIGDQFEQGLANLKSLAEKPPAKPETGVPPE